MGRLGQNQTDKQETFLPDESELEDINLDTRRKYRNDRLEGLSTLNLYIDTGAKALFLIGVICYVI